MNIRLSTQNDIPAIMNIINQAKEQLRKLGVDQWQLGYPNEEVISSDIAISASYVLESGESILSSLMIMRAPEPTYHTIFEGEWLNNFPYVSIHRVCVDSTLSKRGLASFLMSGAEDIVRNMNIFNIRIDTHPDNMPMRRLLEKLGYRYCGVVYMPPQENNAKRIAFQKTL